MSLKYEVNLTYDHDPHYTYIEYTRHGIEHRPDGPAELWGDGFSKFYEYGIFLRQTEEY